MAWITRALHGLAALAPTLSQNATNGLSWYGTLEAPNLPKYLGTQPNPWGSTIPGTGAVPSVGAVRRYNFTVAREYKAPDGYNKSVILVNGQFPGPLIEANWGDIIEVTVTNNIQSTAEALTLHWHGQPIRTTPGEDGVPGISQCPIPPASGGPSGSNVATYRIRAEAFGTGWYHSHVSGQYTDGLYGPMVIYGPSSAPYDIDLGPVMLSDYVHDSYFTVLKKGFANPPALPNVDNNLINGKGISDCNSTSGNVCTPGAGLSKFIFQQNKVHRLRLINTGGEATQHFSIDGHKLTVIANDYVPIQPYDTDTVTLGIGQRTDVLVKATGKANGAYWMRSDVDVPCLNLTATNSHGLAAVYYQKANTSSIPNTQATPWSSMGCGNDPLAKTIPFFRKSLPSQPATTAYFNVTSGINGTGTPVFMVNGSSLEVDYNAPLLPMFLSGNAVNVPSRRNLYDFGSNSSVRLIIKSFFPVAHPMHLHGHNFWVLATGFGDWNGTIVNPSNPQRRDTQLLLPTAPDGTPSYLVLEFQTDNPGVWPLHCHTSPHVSVGLMLNILERPDLIRKQQQPASISSLCKSWAAWTSKNTVDQIDSGV